MTENLPDRSGACVCGSIRYTARNVKPVWYCHCEQCRRMTGHFMAAAQCDLDEISIEGEPCWYFVSDKSKYGFCSSCGSHLFWHNESNNYLSVAAGSLNDTSGLTNKGHIFVAEKGHYYDLPKHESQSDYWPDAEEVQQLASPQRSTTKVLGDRHDT